jgi:hypothetical protein
MIVELFVIIVLVNSTWHLARRPSYAYSLFPTKHRMPSFKVSLCFVLKNLKKEIVGPRELWAYVHKQKLHVCSIFVYFKCH